MTVLAHGIGGRSDLPVPLWLAVYGAAAAVLISFFAVVAFWTGPKLRGAQAGRPLPAAVQRLADAAGTRAALRAVGLILAAITLVAAWFGPPESAHNPAPTWFYVWFWVGLAVTSALLGPVWRLLNPLRSIAAAVQAVAGRWIERWIGQVKLPEAVGYWPAVGSLFAFLWLELVYDHADAPRVVAAFLTGYGLVHVAGGVVYGQRWFDRGDGFEAYSTLLGHLAPFGRRADGRLVLRNPLDGLAALRPAPGLVATVAVLLGSTAFDGLTRTRVWNDITANVERPMYLAVGTAGLVLAIYFVFGTYTAATAVMRRYAPADLAAGIPARFVHSLIPIAFGYMVAHYFSFAVFQGQVGYLLATDPLGRGWDLLGASGRSIDYTVVSPRTIALVQVAAIVTGHVTGVVAAHDRAVATFPRRHLRAAQYPLLIVMVAYTMGGIALLVGS
jgi:hypothetical protein